MSLENEFVKYEQALALKELGFDEPCFGSWEIDYVEIPTYTHCISNFYKNSNHPVGKVTAPLYQQVFRWLLDKHNLYGIIIPTVTMDWTFKTMTVAQDMVEVPPYNHVDACDYSSREEAELACLIKLI